MVRLLELVPHVFMEELQDMFNKENLKMEST